jgi:uncharacterized protein YecT (DUF1311 family)
MGAILALQSDHISRSEMKVVLLLAVCALFVVSASQAQVDAETSPTAKVAGNLRHHGASKVAATSAPPSAETIIGRDLLLDGANGVLRFSGQGDALQIQRFSMLGEVISDPTQQCRIDVVDETTIATKNLGHPDGLQRFAAEIPACPFEFDVLDGAVLLARQIQACVFKEADCQANPSGLWGPDSASIVADAKVKKQERVSADAAMDANYRALAARLKDQRRADALVDEQSRFLADREETCRSYLHEDLYGFCTIRLTEARAAFLKARLDELPQDLAQKPDVRPHHRKPTQ